jgi:hypothetical protein
MSSLTLRKDYLLTYRSNLGHLSLINKLKPGSIGNISTKPLPFLHMENIANFLQVAREEFHLQGSDLFNTVDLHEGKNMQQAICWSYFDSINKG